MGKRKSTKLPPGNIRRRSNRIFRQEKTRKESRRRKSSRVQEWIWKREKILNAKWDNNVKKTKVERSGRDV